MIMSTEIEKAYFMLQIKDMNLFISKYGEEAFNSAVFHGAFSEVADAYIHPSDELKTTNGFETIQRAFIIAYT